MATSKSARENLRRLPQQDGSCVTTVRIGSIFAGENGKICQKTVLALTPEQRKTLMMELPAAQQQMLLDAEKSWQQQQPVSVTTQHHTVGVVAPQQKVQPPSLAAKPIINKQTNNDSERQQQLVPNFVVSLSPAKKSPGLPHYSTSPPMPQSNHSKTVVACNTSVTTQQVQDGSTNNATHTCDCKPQAVMPQTAVVAGCTTGETDTDAIRASIASTGGVVRRHSSNTSDSGSLRCRVADLRHSPSSHESTGGDSSGDESCRNMSEDSDDDEDAGLYMESHRHSRWFYQSSGSVDKTEPNLTLTGEINIDGDVDACQNKQQTSSTSSKSTSPSSPTRIKTSPNSSVHLREKVEGEVELRQKYKHCTRRSVQRASRLHHYERMSERFCDSSHRVSIRRANTSIEYGFQINGSQPAIVSAVTPGSISQEAGLSLGDIIVSVNSVNAMEAKHHEIIQLLKQDPLNLTLDVTSSRSVGAETDYNLQEGYLIKSLGAGTLGALTGKKRWCKLKQDHCLYYYKQQQDKDPLGAILLTNYTITKVTDSAKPFTFKATKYGQKTHFFQAESEDQMNRWACSMNSVAQATNKCSTWLDISSHNVGLPALSIKQPECHGMLAKMGHRYRSWKRRYCVLKDACLYYYVEVNSNTALGVAHLHGYEVQDGLPASSRARKNGFYLAPPEQNMRTFCFCADNNTDKIRWMTAMKKSISKWITIAD